MFGNLCVIGGRFVCPVSRVHAVFDLRRVNFACQFQSIERSAAYSKCCKPTSPSKPKQQQTGTSGKRQVAEKCHAVSFDGRSTKIRNGVGSRRSPRPSRMSGVGAGRSFPSAKHRAENHPERSSASGTNRQVFTTGRAQRLPDPGNPQASLLSSASGYAIKCKSNYAHRQEG